MKKIISVLLALVMMVSMAVPAFAAETTPNDEEILQYLIDAGYSMDIIENMDDATRLQFYERGYNYQSSTTTHGVFTEDYQVTFSVDNKGTVVLDENNRQELIRLLQDKDAVDKILHDKSLNKANNVVVKKALDLNSLKADIIKGDSPIELMSLSNWSASLVVSHVSYDMETNVSTKSILYSWTWEYDPVWELTDKAAIAWSGEYTADPESIRWAYVRRVGYVGSSLETDLVGSSGQGYDDYNPGAGVAKAIDIIGPLPGTVLINHRGSMVVEISKVAETEDKESAVGRYYHTRILPGLELGFSSSGPSISITSSSGSVDKSSDSADEFWVISDEDL